MLQRLLFRVAIIFFVTVALSWPVTSGELKQAIAQKNKEIFYIFFAIASNKFRGGNSGILYACSLVHFQRPMSTYKFVLKLQNSLIRSL